MTFSNPAGAAAAAAATYVRALLDLLGDRDPLEVLASCCPGSSAAPPGCDDAALRRPEAPGKWSVDRSHPASRRHRAGRSPGAPGMMLTEDRPAIQGYDQDAGPASFRYARRRSTSRWTSSAACATANLRLWRSLDPGRSSRAMGCTASAGPRASATSSG